MTTLSELFRRLNSRRRRSVKSPIEENVDHKQEECVHLPESANDEGDTLLHIAVAAHNLTTILQILQTDPAAANAKSTKNGRFGSEMTPLHVAVETDASFEIINVLVNASPRSLKFRNGNGDTPYILAVKVYDGDEMEEVFMCLQQCSTSLMANPRRKVYMVEQTVLQGFYKHSRSLPQDRKSPAAA